MRGRNLKCSICDYNCSDKESLKAHVNSVHENKKPYKCLVCDNIYCFKVNFEKHIALVHENKKPQKCLLCDYSSDIKDI